MRVRSGIWSVKFGKGTTRYRKSEKQQQTANNARRKRATVRSHVSFDHFFPRCRPLPSPCINNKGITLLHSRVFFALSLVLSAHSPFCTYVSLSIVVFSFTTFFLVENTLVGANASLTLHSGASINRKSSHNEDAWKNLGS